MSFLAAFVLPALLQVPVTSTCQEAVLSPSPSNPGSEFGSAVELQGDLAVIGDRGANGFAGVVYVFEYAGGTWTLLQELTPDVPVPGGDFGVDVDVDGSRMVIGAYESTGSGPGRAYVFDQDPTTGLWSQTQELVDPSGMPNDQFGTAVEIDGDRIAVGSRYDDGTATDLSCNEGSVHDFRLIGGSWTWTTELRASDGDCGMEFGASMGLSSGTLAVGAPGDFSGLTTTGKAYVFDPLNVESILPVPVSVGDGDSFGQAIDISGETVVVASWRSSNRAGAAHFFESQGASWVHTQTVADAAEGGELGRQLDVEGDLAAIGAFKEDSTGVAFIYHRDPAGWTLKQKLVGTTTITNDFFSSKLSVSGPRVLIGAMNDNPAPGVAGSPGASGTAFVFRTASYKEEIRAGSPPNPIALMPGQTAPPVIGGTWDPWITPFLPGALLDVLVVGLAPADGILSPFGTILCFPQIVSSTGPPGVNFAIPIPADCSLVGTALPWQGVSVSATELALTNALDVVIGTF